MITPQQAIILFDRCLTDHVSDEEGIELLRYLEDNTEFTKDVYDNLYLDFLLQRRKNWLPEPSRNDLKLIDDNRLEHGNNSLDWLDMPHEPEKGMGGFFENIVQLAASSPTIIKEPKPIEPDKRHKATSKPLIGLNKKHKTTWFPVLLILGAVCLLPLLAYFEFVTKSTPSFEAAGRRPIGVLTDTASVKWIDAMPFRLGEPIHGGRLALKSGYLELLLYNGNRVILEGPADVSLIADNQLFCRSGKLSVTVPPSGVGLTVQTPHTTVEDLGTAFFMDISTTKSDVQVVEGRVQLIDEETKPIRLNKGDAIEIGPDREHKRFPTDFSRFISYDMMNGLSASCFANRERRKQASLKVVSMEPVLHLDFMEVDGKIQNRTGSTGFAIPDVIGGEFVQGRIEGRHALRLAQKDDRVSIHAKTPLESATFSAWIGIEKLDPMTFHPILMSNQAAPDGMLWQIAPDGTLNFGFYSTKSRRVKTYLSPVVFTPDRLGKSIHVALVVDPVRRNVTHYFDGKVAASLPFEGSRPIVLKNTLIGNWMPKSELVGSLGGTIEDFRIYNRALNPDEIYNIANEH